VAQKVESLHGKCEALSSIPTIIQKKKGQKKDMLRFRYVKFLFYFLVVLEFELRALHLLDRHSTTRATFPALKKLYSKKKAKTAYSLNLSAVYKETIIYFQRLVCSLNEIKALFKLQSNIQN
jgi:hypothetical protein